jgi:hypothetical protein
MKRSNPPKSLLVLALMIFTAMGGLSGEAIAASEPLVLARVVYTYWEQLIGLPVYAVLQDDRGIDYALVLAPISLLAKTKADYEILDRNAGSAVYWLARARRSNATPPTSGRWLYYDGRIWVIRVDSLIQNASQAWRTAGFEVQSLPDEPLPYHLNQASPLSTDGFRADVADMISQVNSSTVYTLTGQLSGEWPAVVGGPSYYFTSRNTRNSTAIQKATQFAFEYMQTRNLSPVYQDWSGCPSAKPTGNRNVIGEMPGNMLAQQIILVTAHIDDMPESGAAPGADDNASGAVGVLVAADILRQYEFERTVRFAIFTGEEQGLCGSKAYASQASSLGEEIVAVLNLDMIAWDNEGEPVLNLHTRVKANPSYPQDLAIANAFIGVVDDYGLSSDLSPVVFADNELYSDHSPFWNKGFPAILVIEDDYDDFNPNWHTSQDNLASLNQTYYVNFIRAIVGTSATLALPHMDEKVFFPIALSGTQ